MASIGPIQPGAPYLLPPGRDNKLAKRRKSSYDRTADDADQLDGSSAADDDYEAALLTRFPPGSGPVNWVARLIFQTYHSVLRPKLGRIVDILA
ncbi:MAG TPA: hypothetical protein VMW62_12575 [Chloroflexota bacterium]|nr:hypothetical protein [Chloroflexota bacterium]